MSRRPPSTPPFLPGFEHIRLLGSGGFADVFLYQQLHPRRQVAVKVLLLEAMSSSSADGFTDEANLMAQLATHPSIVSVYQAGVSDDSRPYLVMEYCSRPNLQVRHRRERFSEPEALRVGVQIAGAIETAHRTGILHRDIKPANILVTEYGRPALTDFGISSTTTSDMAGLSVPWSPPEAFRRPPEGSPASDVYSLAATMYTLLTNRSPFEIPGASNQEIDIISRIQSQPLPALGRSDVSAHLGSILLRAMAKNPADRYPTAMDFGYALQRVQIELGMQATPIDVVEDELDIPEDDEDDGRTRFRSIATIDAQAPASDTATSAPARPAAALPLEHVGPSESVDRIDPTLSPRDLDALRARQNASPSRSAVRGAPPAVPAPPPLDDTRVRSTPDAIAPKPGPPRNRSRVAPWLIGGAAVFGAAALAIALAVAPDGVGVPRPSAPAAGPVDAVDDVAPPPLIDQLVGTAVEGGVLFSWVNPAPEQGDTYLWRPVVPGESFAFEETTGPEVVVPPDSSGAVCIEVVLRRANGTSAAEGVQGCAS